MAEPASPLPPRMTADEFIEWSRRQPEGMHYELSDGVTVRMAAERINHMRVKFAMALSLQNAIGAAGAACEVLLDRIGVRVDNRTFYEPDISVRCGPAAPGDNAEINDPTIIVEVLSPSTQSRDFEQKFQDYFRLASLRHYLIVNPDTGRVVHHRRDETSGKIETKIVADGVLALDPPGIEVEVADFFASLPPEQTAEPEADS
jgi:Uma2 family endonuclease